MSSSDIETLMAARAALGRLNPRRVRAVAFVGVLLLGACSSDGVPGGSYSAIAARLAFPFELRIGERAALDRGGLEVTFRSVSDDSRCPSDVICVWSGDATAHLELTLVSGATATMELHTHVEPHEAIIGSYAIRLAALAPYPDTTRTIGAGDYIVTLEVRPPS